MNKGLISLIAIVCILLCLLPIVSVFLAAVTAPLETISRLADTVLFRYIVNTLMLVFWVTGGSILIGTITAWIVSTTEFPGRKILEIALVIPLAFPAYIIAYAYTDILDHPGIVQSTLRQTFNLGPRDYWFPEIRSLGGAACMLVLVLYPYVYLLARSVFKSSVANAFNAAQSLGASRMRAFLFVALPMARPAIAAGAFLVIMETIADFGTVSYFSVQTFATGIYTSWIGLGERGAAAQLALGLLAFALLIAFLEYNNRKNLDIADADNKRDVVSRIALDRTQTVFAQLICALPIVFGAIIPASALLLMGMNAEQNIFSERYARFFMNTLVLATLAAVVTVLAAVFISTLNRFLKSRLSLLAMFIGRLGYAVPGGVIAVGLLVPFASFDNWLDSVLTDLFGISTGLLFTGSIALLVAAYMIRFLAAAIGAYDSGLSTISINVDRASQIMGSTTGGTIRQVHLPMLKLNVFTAALIVFVDTIKELPATLILRPFNYDTLAVQAYRLAADERLEAAALPSLIIALIGLIPVLLLCLRLSETQKSAPLTARFQKSIQY